MHNAAIQGTAERSQREKKFPMFTFFLSSHKIRILFHTPLRKSLSQLSPTPHSPRELQPCLRCVEPHRPFHVSLSTDVPLANVPILGIKVLNPSFDPRGPTKTDDCLQSGGYGDTGQQPEDIQGGAVFYLWHRGGAFDDLHSLPTPHLWSRAHQPWKRPVQVQGSELNFTATSLVKLLVTV